MNERTIERTDEAKEEEANNTNIEKPNDWAVE